MTLFLNRIEKKEWLTLLRKIGIEQKWFISIFHQCKNEFYSVDFLSRSEERIQIGTCTFSKINTETDCSIFIFPEHRRKGFATQLILDLTARYENIQFTVSTYNTISLRLFDVIPLLKNSESNSKNKTCTFIKKNNYLMHKMNNQLNNFNNEKKWFKKLLKETTLLENSNISSKDLYLLELYLKGFSDVKMIIETKLTKNKIEVILLKSLVKITKRINELENKENYLNELITNIKEKENRAVENDLNLNVETKINQVAEVEKLNLSIRAKNALVQLNINEVKELSQLTIEKILSVPNLGKKTLTEIIDVANDYGIELK